MASTPKQPKPTRLPQYRPSLVSAPAYDYRVYHLSIWETLLYGVAAFVVAGLVGLLFFGGLGRDAEGAATTATRVLDAIIFVVPGIFAARTFLKVRAEQIRRTRIHALETQFRDMLDSLSSSLQAGGTVIQGVQAARSDMERQYSPDAPIVKELTLIVAGFHNNVRLEDMLLDLGERSGSEDVMSFATVFEIAYLRGADMRQAVRNTHQILSEKMSIAAEIETSLVASKNQTLIMAAIPVLIVWMLKSGGNGMGEALRTPVGVVASAVAVGLFVASFALARKIMTIKI